MSATITTNYRALKKIKAGNFDTEKLPSYTLCLQIGIRDFQFCVINNQTSRCLVIEDYLLENIKTINSRLEAIQSIIESHPILSDKKWGKIKVSFKTHKFSLVPRKHFLAEAASDYLSITSDIKTKIENVYYYKHIASDAVNIFAADHKVLNWLISVYPNRSLQVVHQGSSFIEGVLAYDDHADEKSMFAYIDRRILHLIVTENKKLLYYNQFAARTAQDYLKYIMLVFKELGLSQKTNKLILWGMLKNDGPQVDLLKKYIRNISLGTKPNFLKLPDAFNEIAEHKYFDLYSIFLCE